MGDEVIYGQHRCTVEFCIEGVIVNSFNTYHLIGPREIKFLYIEESKLEFAPPKLEIAKEPIIELSYDVKIKGYHLTFTHKELKEVQTLLNGVL
jgi:hypothetical protein